MGSKFSGNVRNECRNSHAKFGGAARRLVYAIWKKPQGGGADNRPPSVRGLMKLYCGGNLQFFKEANISGQMLLTGGGEGQLC